MTLNTRVLPLTQVDTTLVDVRRYVRLLKEAKRIKTPGTRAAVLYVLECAYENANDTTMHEGKPLTEWDNMFYGSVGVMLCHHNPSRDEVRAGRWFIARGVNW